MTRAERIFRDLSRLYEFNRRLQEWKKRAIIRDPLNSPPGRSSVRGGESPEEQTDSTR